MVFQGACFHLVFDVWESKPNPQLESIVGPEGGWRGRFSGQKAQKGSSDMCGAEGDSNRSGLLNRICPHLHAKKKKHEENQPGDTF